MGANPVADIFAVARLALDTGTFEAEAGRAGDKAGQTAGAKMRASLQSKLTGAISAGVGAAAGAALGIAISGAQQLNELAGEYQVQTGADTAAAKEFSGVLNDLYKTSHQGYDEIAQTLIGLKTHFDLDGQAAQALAANYLDFAEVAGGTGSDAVERFNSLIKTGIIGIDDTTSTMDLLVVAHQKLGIPINATIDSMVRLAPAMNAVNMNVKDGVALVGLFTKAGVSGDRMAQAFNTALTKIKSPADFPKLINDIATAKDDFTAANIAADYFGTRVGPALANLLRQGTDALDGYNASLGDTAGALDKAAYANDHTFGGQALLMLHNFQGTLTDVATSMGTTTDAIMVATALLGPKVITGLGAGIGFAAGRLAPLIVDALLGPSVAAAGTVGTAMGTATATAATVTEGAELAAGQAAVAAEVTPAATRAGLSIGGAFALAVATAAGAGLALWAGGVLTDWWNNLGKSIGIPMPPAGSGLPGAEQYAVGSPEWLKTHPNSMVPESALPKESAAASAAALPERMVQSTVRQALSPDELAKAVKDYMRAGVLGIENARPDLLRAMADDMKPLAAEAVRYQAELRAAGITVGSSFANGIALSGANVRAAAESILKAAADGIRSRRSDIDSAIDQVNEDLKAKAITQTAEVTNLVTSLLSPALSKALSSPDKQVQADAKYLEQLLTDRLGEINLRPGIISDKTKALIDNAKKSADPQIREFAKTFEDLYAQDLGRTADSPKVQDAGTDVGTTTAKSMVQGAIEWLGSATARQQLGDAWAAAVASVSAGLRVGTLPGGWNNPNWRDSGGPVYAGTPYRIGVPEVFIPAVDGRILNESQIARLPAGGDRNQTFNIDHITVADANDEMSVIQRLRFMALAQG